MRGLVIVDEDDMAQARYLVSRDEGLSSEIFGIDDAMFEWCKFYVDRSNHAVLEHADGSREDAATLGKRWSVVILIAGTKAAQNNRLNHVLKDFLGGAVSPAWANEALVVISLAPMRDSLLHSLTPPRVFFTPGSQDSTSSPYPSPSWMQQVTSEFDGLVRMIDENQTRNPNVGFGLLLLDNECRCFLMERLRDPGRGKLGTIGGNFERGHDIVSELSTVLLRRFRQYGGPKVDLGPMLSCTNMKSEFLHYIDLTFLAKVKGGSVSDVLDEELRPPSEEALRCLPGQGTHPTRLLFTLPEVAIFHREGLLFTPVANAFEALCRRIFAEQLRHGRRRRIELPSLIDESQVFELTLPDDLNCIREIATTMPWSKSAPPMG